MNSKLFFTATTLLISIFIAVDPIGLFTPPSVTFSSNKLRRAEILPLVGAIGAESFAFDPIGGGPYTGVSGGRIIKWQENERQWVNFALTSTERREKCEGWHDDEEMEHICGRPLGLCFNELTGDLYVADAYLGLLMVGPDGGSATRIVTQAQSIPFRFTNGLDIHQRSGAVYFSDSSSNYQRREFLSLIISGDKTGRLLKYDPESKQVTVLLDKLSYLNGVALSEDGSFILLAETINCRILKFWLQTSKAGTYEVLLQLPGFPDNIKRSPRGDYWVAVYSKKGKLLQWILSYTWLRKVLLKLPHKILKLHSVFAKWKGYALAIRFSEEGEVLEVLENKRGNTLKLISEVEEKNGTLWIGSVVMPFVGVYKM
ncbi:hypothetical protein HHK36_017182 [Tetracentron sinense]|uniref:Strictosidine synthase conserved region domain-containing protein n=1 Tax=Tetracentron sinense TaxID=13715 RepID=A0A834Z0X3_TETSI|nr:hypothetical protein HHK36_017182 [Tetracentron sinense]